MAFHPHWTMSNTIVLRTLVVQRTRPQEDGCPSPRQTIDRCSPHRSNRGAAWLTDRPFSVSRPMRTRTPRWPTSARSGEFTTTGSAGPVAAAVLVKGIDGKLRRGPRTTRRRLDLSWGGALIGGALAVVAAPLAIAPLSVVATQDGTWAGVGGIVGHFWHNIPKSPTAPDERPDRVGPSRRGDRGGRSPRIRHRGPVAERHRDVVTETDGGDLEQAYHEALAADQPLS